MRYVLTAGPNAGTIKMIDASDRLLSQADIEESFGPTRPTPPVYVFEIKGRRSFTRDAEERGGGRRESSRSKEVI